LTNRLSLTVATGSYLHSSTALLPILLNHLYPSPPPLPSNSTSFVQTSSNIPGFRLYHTLTVPSPTQRGLPPSPATIYFANPIVSDYQLYFKGSSISPPFAQHSRIVLPRAASGTTSTYGLHSPLLRHIFFSFDKSSSPSTSLFAPNRRLLPRFAKFCRQTSPSSTADNMSPLLTMKDPVDIDFTTLAFAYVASRLTRLTRLFDISNSHNFLGRSLKPSSLPLPTLSAASSSSTGNLKIVNRNGASLPTKPTLRLTSPSPYPS